MTYMLQYIFFCLSVGHTSKDINKTFFSIISLSRQLNIISITPFVHPIFFCALLLMDVVILVLFVIQFLFPFDGCANHRPQENTDIENIWHSTCALYTSYICNLYYNFLYKISLW